MNKFCIIIFLFTCRICTAQNLVPNGDFEQYSGCPNNHAQLDSALYWFTPQLTTSSDYFNQCSNSFYVDIPNNYFGFQYARSGVGYSGIYLWNLGTSTNYREYIEVQLNTTLAANACYLFEMYISHANNSMYATDEIGIYFSDSSITGIPGWTVIPLANQISNPAGNFPDTANWTPVSLSYTATGGENFLIIGNFKDNLSSDTSLVDPNAPYTEIYVYIDDVSLTLCTGIEELNQNVEIMIYPNPVMDILNVNVSNNELSEILIYDITSRKLLQKEFTNSVSLNTEQLAKGIYIYELHGRNGLLKKGKFVKN